MGAVYAATHRNRKRFAIKMLHPELSSAEEVRSRFLREGYVANTVGHAGAVAVLDDDVAEDGSAFLVMELLEGTSIEDFWEKSGRALPYQTLLVVFDQVLDVLDAAHAQGIVHRDIKPANLFLTYEGQLKVLDFGIARLRDAATRGLTQTGATMGTPAFMAPEQALGKGAEIDAQTDLWAVGATLFVLLTGRLVHEGATAQELLVNSATRPAPSLASVAPNVPAPVARLVDGALGFHKSERWSSAREMQRALGRAHLELCGTDVHTAAQLLRARGGATLLMAPPRHTEDATATASVGRDRNAEPHPDLARGQSAGLAVAQATGAQAGAGATPVARAWWRLAGPLSAILALACLALSLLAQLRSSPSVVSSSAPSAALPGDVSPSPAPSVSSSPGAVASASTQPRQHRSPSPRPGDSPPAAVAAPADVGCARLLERQSLGEPLSPSERTTFSRYCRESR